MKIMNSNIFKICTFALAGLAAILFLSQPAFAQEPLPEDWEFGFNFNLWVPDIKGETTTGTDFEISLSDIIENLDITVMSTLRAKKGKWFFLTDIVYMGLEDSSNHNLLQGPPLNLDLTNVELTAWIVTPMVAYNVVHSERLDLYLLAGARYLWQEIKAETRTQMFLLPSEKDKTTVSGDVWDGIVGVRGAIPLDEKWYLPFHGDVGTGDTDLTWQVFSGVGYKFTNLDVTLGYRHLEWEFDEDEGHGVLENLYVSGPMVGIKYTF
jgi:opacity protein-like surface antigen